MAFLPWPAHAAGAAAAGQPQFQVPPNFKIERVAGPPEINFPMFGTLDDRQRLYVTESSGGDLYAELREQIRQCRISQLEDRDGDGHYETTRVFADKLAQSMGIAWREGKLYVADPPDLVTWEDTDGDGRADKRQVVLTGFGHTDNGSLHGLTFGPDGWLYFTMGDPDSYDLKGPDGSRVRGSTGALIRSRADGSGLETIGRGFENLVEVVFLPDGSVIGTVNWYQVPDLGLRDALVQILPGSQFPLHPVDGRFPHLQLNRILPPLTLFPAVAHSGLVAYQGTGLPASMHGSLFSAQHNARKIVRHELTPRGASYAVANFDFVSTEDPDVHFSDVLELADGSLLAVDTGSWYVHHCPTGRIRHSPARGALYRISYSAAGRDRSSARPTPMVSAAPSLSSTNPVVSAAAARAIGWNRETSSAAKLLPLLKSPQLGVRLAAAEALAYVGTNDAFTPLVQALAGETDPFLEHALTFALHRTGTAALLRSAVEHPHPKVQRAALLLLDQPPYSWVTPEIVLARVNAADPAVKDAARWILRRHTDWSDAGATFLKQLIQANEADARTLREFLPLFRSNAAVIATVARSLAPLDDQIPVEQKVTLLEAVGGVELNPVPAVLAEALKLLVTQAPSAALRSAAIRAGGALRLADLETVVTAVAHDPTQPSGLRAEALRELIRRRPVLEPDEFDFLLSELAPAKPSAVRLSAAETVASAKLSSTQMKHWLQTVRADPLISPVTILDAADRTGLRGDYLDALVDYLANSLAAGWTIAAERLDKIQNAIPETARSGISKLTAQLTATIARQREQLAEFEPLLRGGDRARGQALFFGKAQCTACHRVWENGGRVGPDLTRIGTVRAGRDLLESIVIPSATIAQGYETVVVTAKDGETHTGIRSSKRNEPLVLRGASGTETTWHSAQIARVESSKLSLMPEGLLQQLTQDEIRDLLAFLQQLK